MPLASFQKWGFTQVSLAQQSAKHTPLGEILDLRPSEIIFGGFFGTGFRPYRPVEQLFFCRKMSREGL